MQTKLVPSGTDSWTARVELPPGLNGVRRQKRFTFKGKKTDAKAALEKFKAAVTRGEYVDAGRLTMSGLLDRWLASRSTRVERNTYERYEQIVNAHIRPVLGHFRVSALSAAHIDEALQTWKAMPRRDRKKGALSQRTIHHIFNTLRGCLNFAVKQELILKNPCSGVDEVSRGDGDVTGLDPRIITDFLGELRDTIVYVPALIAAFGGLRRGEVLGLHWVDVDLESGIIFVHQSLEEDRDGHLRLKGTKTKNSVRRVALPAFVMSALNAHRDELIHVYGTARLPAHVFPDWETGGLWSPDQLSSKFYYYVHSRGLPKVSFHGLRHTYSNLMKSVGAPLIVTSRAMGHSDIAVTANIYTDVLLPELANAASALNSAFGHLVGQGRRNEQNRARHAPCASRTMRVKHHARQAP